MKYDRVYLEAAVSCRALSVNDTYSSFFLPHTHTHPCMHTHSLSQPLPLKEPNFYPNAPTQCICLFWGKTKKQICAINREKGSILLFSFAADKLFCSDGSAWLLCTQRHAKVETSSNRCLHALNIKKTNDNNNSRKREWGWQRETKRYICWTKSLHCSTKTEA